MSPEESQQDSVSRTRYSPSSVLLLFRMDFSDVGVRHSVALSDLYIHHLLEFSPSAVTISREVRYCVIAVVFGWITTRVVSELSKRRGSHENS